MDKNKLYGAIWAAYCADAYALGPHWEYNTKKIEEASLDWRTYDNPIRNYHMGKKAGDFTHYGDQALWLLEHTAEKSSFDPETFISLWIDRMNSYSGYMDHASEETLKNIKGGADYHLCGSDSTDISAVGRMFPLLLVYGDNSDLLKEKAKIQTALTHNSPEVVESAVFFAELSAALLAGNELEKSLESITPGYTSRIQDWVRKGRSSTGKKTSLTIKRFGQACSVAHGFPGVIHLITKYTNNYRLAMEENVKSGGDSAARGIVAGMILGIINGEEAVPENWKNNLTEYNKIKELIKRF